jgi:cyclase
VAAFQPADLRPAPAHDGGLGRPGYLEFVLATAAKGIDAGLSPLDLARQVDLGEYAEWLDSERIVGNLHRAYADLGAARPDVDVVAALGDMVEYNHGQPLSCFA